LTGRKSPAGFFRNVDFASGGKERGLCRQRGRMGYAPVSLRTIFCAAQARLWLVLGQAVWPEAHGVPGMFPTQSRR